MSTPNLADILIIGGGLYGCATAYYLAKNGAKNVVLLERGDLCSGGTAKSCAILRTHYSIESNLVHAVESLNVFKNFNDVIGGDIGFRKTGYIIVGPNDHKVEMLTVFANQNRYGIDTAVLSPTEANKLHPLLRLDDVGVIGYDSMAGFADPYLTVSAFADRAKAMGVSILTNTTVKGLSLKGGVKKIQTDQGDWEGVKVILAAGPWTKQLGLMFGIEFPIEISNHKVITLKIDQPYQLSWPIVKDLTSPDKIYFRPEVGGVVLVGTGDHGDPIDHPDYRSDYVDPTHVERIGGVLGNRMPSFSDASYVSGWTGPYDITPDWNPIVGEVPEHQNVYVAAGFSGHGFKLAPTIGASLAQSVLGIKTDLPIDMYAMDRFTKGEALFGAYGIGSIS